jgi:hypothetical protein
LRRVKVVIGVSPKFLVPGIRKWFPIGTNTPDFCGLLQDGSRGSERDHHLGSLLRPPR